MGYALALGDSDTTEDCKVYRGPRYHAAAAFIIGFWLLDFSNNNLQGPARAMMADLSGRHGPSAADAIFWSWMAPGNILGYSSGSTNDWHYRSMVPVSHDQGLLRGLRQSQSRLLGRSGVIGVVDGGDDGEGGAAGRGGGGGEAERRRGVRPSGRTCFQGDEEPPRRDAVDAHRPHLALVVPLHPLRHRLDGPRREIYHDRPSRRGRRLPGRRWPGCLRPPPQLDRAGDQLVPDRADVPAAGRPGGVGDEQRPRVRRHGGGVGAQRVVARRLRRVGAGRGGDGGREGGPPRSRSSSSSASPSPSSAASRSPSRRSWRSAAAAARPGSAPACSTSPSSCRRWSSPSAPGPGTRSSARATSRPSPWPRCSPSPPPSSASPCCPNCPRSPGAASAPSAWPAATNDHY
uniref:Uncharacterized protein n=1 Tax=Oryza brachyantha TaxID=4533 RepID=J3N2H7_ORYBR